MAQTTGGMSFKDAAIFQSTDGSTWTSDISGIANMVEVSGGERSTGEAYTADGDTAIITRGKRAPLTVTVRGVYTETANELYDEANDAYEGGTDYYIRWSPLGDDATELRYTTSAGTVKNPVYPSGDASSGDALIVEVVVECASITEATVV